MSGETFQQQQSREIFGVTMTEFMLLFLFGFIIIVEALSGDLRLRERELDALLAANRELAEFRDDVESMLLRLGTRLKDLPDDWHQLTKLKTVAQEHKKALRAVERITKVKRQLQQELKVVQEKAASLKRDLEEIRKIPLGETDEALAKARHTIAEQKRELVDLRRKVAALEAPIEPESPNERGPGDPACWRNADGKIEFLLSVIMFEKDFVVQPAWLAARESEARRLGLMALPLGERISEQIFVADFKSLYLKTVEMGCRHYVYVYDQTDSKRVYKRKLKVVEGYFYKSLR